MEKSLEACFINDVLNLRRQYSHMPFNIWSLPQLLRFCETKLANHRDVHKIIIPKYSIQKKKNKKEPLPNKNFPMSKDLFQPNPMPKKKKKKKKILPCPKIFVSTKISCPTKIFHVEKKILQCPTKICPCLTIFFNV